MGTALCFKQVSPTTLEFLKANPEYFDTFIEEIFLNYDNHDDYEPEPLPRELLRVIAHDDPVGETSVDYAWDTLRFLLEPLSNDKNLPVSASVTGLKDTMIQYEDSNYDIYYFNSEQITTLTMTLEAISQEDFLANFDGTTMNKLNLYGFHWTENGDTSLKTELWDYFTLMRNYYADAAKRSYGMLVYFVF